MRFRKKPVVIEAVQFSIPKMQSPVWLDEAAAQMKLMIEPHSVTIWTLEGVMTAYPGDWIIRGVNGEIYPCKPDIFAKTYEPVE